MNIILKTSTFLFPLITFPYVSRVLGAGANGNISFASSVISYFTLCACLGIPSYGIRKCAEVRDDSDLLSKTFEELFIINIICTVISYLALIVLIYYVPQFYHQKLLFLVTSLNVIFNSLGIDWFYQAIEQYDYITVRNIAFKLISIILMFTFVHKPSDYVLYAGISVLASVGSNLLNLSRVSQYVTLKKYSNFNFFKHMKPIVILFLYNATTTIFTNLDQVMLGFMSSSKEVGYYAATVKVKNILTSIITALGAVMLPRVAYYLNKNDNRKFVFLIRESFNFILVSAIPLSVFFIIDARPIILFLAGSGYSNSIAIMQAIAPSIIFIGLSSVTAWQLLIPLKMESYTVVGAFIGAVINIVLNISLIPGFGGRGAAIATTIAEAAVLLTHIYVLRDKIKDMFSRKEFIITVVAGSISMVCLVVFNGIADINNLFLQCLISSIVFFGIYCLFLFILGEPTIKRYITDFMRRIK